MAPPQSPPDPTEVAATLRVAIGLMRRRLRQLPLDGELTLPEMSALARLDRGGPATSAALAREEQISPQSMGATVAGLDAKGLVTREADPDDGRRQVLSLTTAGTEMLRRGRDARTEQMARVLRDELTDEELAQLAAAAPLLERLARAL